MIFQSIIAQEFELKIEVQDSINKPSLDLISYKSIHQSKEDVYLEIDSVNIKLHNFGFLNSQLDTIIKHDSLFTAYFNLGLSTKSIKVFYNNGLIDKNFIKTYAKNYTDAYFEISIQDVSKVLNGIVQQFELEGKSFTEVSLKNIQSNNNEFIAELNIVSSHSRTIDKIILKSYEKFPKSFIKHHLNLKAGTVFNTDKLEKASNSIRSLSFASESKLPEVLFAKDSTIVYLYLKKNKSNRFDGLIGFNTDDSGKLKFNGYLDLLLNNVLNKGEMISIKWKSNGDDRKLFDLAFESPYIFNSPISPKVAFNIYKQDSTFINTKAIINLSYTLNQASSVSANLQTENSNDLLNNTQNNISSFKNLFYGASYIYRKPDYFQASLYDKFHLSVNTLFGTRTLTNSSTSTKQQKYNLEIYYNWRINTRNSIFFKNESGMLISDDLITNELYRIGGANSIRGFNEESIFASTYSILNLEYRYLLGNLSYIYSITDVAYVQNDIINDNTQIYSFGLGYTYKTKNGVVDLSYAIGKQSEQSLDFRDSRFHIKLIQFF